MKRTQLLDHFRNIRKQFVSWLSIIIIAMLAVIAYLGIRFTAGSLRENINSFYDETKYRDVEVLSTLLFSEEDLKLIQELDTVENAVGFRSYDTIIKSSSSSRNITLLSFDDTINVPKLTKGSYPKEDNDVLVEASIANALGLEIGDIIYTNPDPYLKQNIFTVSGICIHPDHIAKLMDNSAKGYVIVNKNIFDPEAFDNCFSKVEIRFADLKNDDHFSDRYFDQVSTDQSQIEDLSESRKQVRYNAVVKKMQDAIDENNAKLEEGKKQLDEARAQLDEKQQEAKDGEKKLNSSYSQLKSAKAQLDTAKQTLDQVAGEFTAAEMQLKEADEQLQDGKRQLEDGYRSFIDARNRIKDLIIQNYPDAAEGVEWPSDEFDVDDPNLTLTKFPVVSDFTVDLTSDDNCKLVSDYLKENYPDAADQIDIEDFQDKAKLWESKHKEYLEGRDKYLGAYGEYRSQYRVFIQNLGQYEEGLAQYESGMTAYRKGLRQLTEAKKELEEKEKEYAEKYSEYEEGVKALEEAKSRLNEIPENRWIFMNVKGNASYVFAKSLSNNFSGISVTFSLLFVVIGALVIYATVGKTIDEQRKQVGTTKALGFFNFEIMSKYLVFGLSATIIGITAGILLSYFVLLKITMRSQMDYFHIGEGKQIFEPMPVVLVCAAAILLTILAVYLACSRMVKQPARILMQDSAPLTFGRKGSSSNDGGSLYSKLIFRNMLADPKRVFVTIVSIAGSCALILIGLTILHSISSATDLQFNKIYRYDYQIDYDVSINENVEAEIETALKKNNAQYIRIYLKNSPFMSNDELDSARFFCGDLNEISDFIMMSDIKDKKEMTELSNHGIYVPIKANENGHFTENGKITVFDEVMNSYDADVAEPFMLYAARFFILSRDYYHEIYGKDPVDNQYLLRVAPENAEQLKEDVLKISGVNKYLSSANDKIDFDSFVSIARGMVILLTAMSFAMAYFILLNLVNMFINQKKRELTVMRVNGFTVKEVKNYVGRELIVTTIAGILIGIPLGIFMAYRIILLLENINCFDRSIYYPGCLIAAGVTAIFSALISASALRKVKDLKLTDI